MLPALTEAAWLGRDFTALLDIERHASVRKLRLIAAAFVRHLQTLPEHDEAKRCDDLLEATADAPRPCPDLRSELEARPGLWGFTHMLAADDPCTAAKELRRLVAFYGTDPPLLALDLTHEIVPNPFRRITVEPEWRTSTALALAGGIDREKAFDRLPILADALQDAGCENPDILDHCREPRDHVRGCWVVDRVLDKA